MHTRFNCDRVRSMLRKCNLQFHILSDTHDTLSAKSQGRSPSYNAWRILLTVTHKEREREREREKLKVFVCLLPQPARQLNNLNIDQHRNWCFSSHMWLSETTKQSTAHKNRFSLHLVCWRKFMWFQERRVKKKSSNYLCEKILFSFLFFL